jgi:hypothetical protein
MDLTHQAHSAICEFLAQRPPLIENDTALDGTAGNGFDTLFLAEQMQPNGRVVALDMHPVAIANTGQRLQEAGLSGSVQLFQTCHSQLDRVLSSLGVARISIAMFNLGYLPYWSAQDTATQATTTIQALQKAFERLEGIMTVLAYVGHPGGKEESLAIEDWLSGLHATAAVSSFRNENPLSPILWIIRSDERLKSSRSKRWKI